MNLSPSLGFSVSATTRKKRETEVEGRDYFFLSEEDFRSRVRNGEFVEWEEVYPGKLYGTLKAEVDRLLNDGHDVVFDVDVKGGLSIKKQYPEACLIFIRPPSVDALQQRLTGRKTEDEAMLAKRLERVPLELELGNEFDYQVVNEILQTAVDDVQKIVTKHLQLNQGAQHGN